MTTLALDELSTRARRELGLDDSSTRAPAGSGPVPSVRRPAPPTARLCSDGRWRRKPLPATPTIQVDTAVPGGR